MTLSHKVGTGIPGSTPDLSPTVDMAHLPGSARFPVGFRVSRKVRTVVGQQPSIPTQPKGAPGENRQIGKQGMGLGAAGLVIWFLLRSLLHLNWIWLAAISGLLFLGGLYLFFSKDDDAPASGGGPLESTDRQQ